MASYGKQISSSINNFENLIQISKNYPGFASNNVDKTTFIYKLSK